MEVTAAQQPFNATQLHLLKMFSFTKTENCKEIIVNA